MRAANRQQATARAAPADAAEPSLRLSLLLGGLTGKGLRVSEYRRLRLSILEVTYFGGRALTRRTDPRNRPFLQGDGDRDREHPHAQAKRAACTGWGRRMALSFR